MGRKKILCYSKALRHRLYTTNLYTRDFDVLVPLYNKVVFLAKNCRCTLQGCCKYRQCDFLITSTNTQDFLDRYKPPKAELT